MAGKDDYDANVAPEPQAWLALDEGERIARCEAHHRSSSCDHPLAPNPRLHAVTHCIVENQIALDETPVAGNVDRLVRDGLTRHAAIHAIGSLLAETLWASVRDDATPFDTDGYSAAVRSLDAHAWRAAAAEESAAADRDLSIDEIITALHTPLAEVPRDALYAAQMKPPGVVDALMELLQTTRRNFDEGRPRTGVAHLLAMLLLASFEEPRAFGAVADFCTLDETGCNQLLGDFVLVDLPRVFASLCGDDTTALERIVESPTRDDYIRAAAVQAFVILVHRRIIPRETAIAYFGTLLRRRLQRVPSAVWNGLARNIIDLHATELFDDLRRRMKDGLVADFLISEQALAQAEEKTLEAALVDLAEDADLEPVRDVTAEVESWPFFGADDFDDDADEQLDDTDGDDWQAPYVRLTPKVGRNDPCPCGSGKKYKKCCLDAGK